MPSAGTAQDKSSVFDRNPPRSRLSQVAKIVTNVHHGPRGPDLQGHARRRRGQRRLNNLDPQQGRLVVLADLEALTEALTEVLAGALDADWLELELQPCCAAFPPGRPPWRVALLHGLPEA